MAATEHSKPPSMASTGSTLAGDASVDVPEKAPASTAASINEKQPETTAEDVSFDKDPADEADMVYPSAFKLTLIMLALCLAVFLVALDQTILATAIPKITDDFKALSDVGWYGSAYMLTLASFQLVYGKVYTYFSLKWTFLAAIGIFELGSLICGVAPNSTTLIVGRAIAGLGCAGIFSGALIILGNSVPLRRRPLYMGIIGGMFAIASVAGPLLGGVFTDRVSWRWCFYINLPLGAVTILAITVFFKPPERKNVDSLTWQQKLKEFDWPGTALLMPSVICLLLALQWGGAKYPWQNARIIALLVLFGVLIITFCVIQYFQGDRATVPPRILMNRSILSSVIVISGAGSVMMILIYYIPIWLQSVKGVSAVKSGIMNLPLVLGVTFLSIVAGGLTTIFGYYVPFVYLGTIMMTVGAGLLSTWDIDTGHAKWIGYQFIAGAGIGLTVQQPMMAAQAVLKLEDVPIGTSMIVFFQTLLGALFISIAQNVFQNKLVQEIAANAPSIPAATILSTGATQIRSAFPPEILPGVLHSYSAAVTQCFYAAVAMGVVGFLGGLPMEWISVKGKKIEAGPA